MRIPYYQLVVKVPGNAKGVVLTSLTYSKDGEELKAEDSSTDVDPICGTYERTPCGNDWHYVTVTKEGENYKWTNKAGRSWLLDGSTLDIGEDCPYYGNDRHNVPTRNARGIVTAMVFQTETYHRMDYDGSPDLAEAKKLWWPGETQNLVDLSDGKKLLLVPLKMIQYDQQDGLAVLLSLTCLRKV